MARALAVGLGFLGVLAATAASAAEPLWLPMRLRVETARGSGEWRIEEKRVAWDPSRTAIVVCDMWDRHWCEGATRRVAEMAPRMNEVLKEARARGVLIIHCPSDTMRFYEGTPQRRLAQEAPKAPKRPEGWRSLDPSREPPLPIDDSDGGCDDWPQCKQHGPWKRQIPTLEVMEGDAITDSDEAYNLMRTRGITNVAVMGVHLNMCVLGRPFSIRQMVSHGQNVVLVRDLTDTMYNSRMPPYVSHFAGTDLVTEHVEKYWCPSTTSAAFVGGEPFRFGEDRRPRVVFLIGEDEYRTWETLPAFARTELQWRGFETRIVLPDPANKHEFPGLVEALRDADLLVLSVRRRALPKAQLDAIRAHLAAGRPVVGIRTASHAFAPRGNDASQGDAWEAFDAEVLGGNYHGHHGAGPRVGLRMAPAADGHPILTGVEVGGFTSAGSLYRTSPLREGTRALLLGTIPGQPEEPVAWVRAFGGRQARVFYTSLGHPEDFAEAGFRRLLLNGILWSMDRPIPPPSGAAPRQAAVDGVYRESWQSMVVPGTWEERAPKALAGYDGMAWYRCLVRPPAAWRDREWELWVENVDNVHEAYLDGLKVGEAGRFPPDYANGLDVKQRYRVPVDARRAGEWQVVAIRVYDREGRGGFKGRAPALRAGDEVIALAGEWAFRAGDDAEWARLAAGESLGNHLFHEVISLEKYERGGVPEKVEAAAKPLSPEESARRFTVMDGLEMELVLSEPEIAQPLQISFDERGRLWLVEYRQYPAPAGLTLVSHDQFWRAVYDRVPPPPPRHFRGRDRITIHEDTDGDGAYDRHTVFVDGLNIATAAAQGRGGVWVLNPPYLLFYPDRDGNDVPDGDPEVHLEGFGLEDTHSVVNSLRWGPDGWLYAAQGSTVSGRVRRPGSTHEPVQTLGQNIWRYHPETRRYEVFAEGGGNAFGVEMDDAGRIFSGHNGGNTRGFHYVQGGYLQKGFEKHGQLSNPHAYGYFPAMAHHDVERFTHTFLIYGGGALSAGFDGRLFGIEPMQGRVVMSLIERDRTTFRTRDVGYAVTSADPWFKPVDIKSGPDGAIYVADWCDFQVNHWRNYQGNMDAANGRVYRLKARGAKPARPEDLGRLTSAQLVERLSNPNRWQRQTALRLLGDRRDPAVVGGLGEQLWNGRGQPALEALWGLQASGGFTPEIARRALAHPTAVVREWTVRRLGDSGDVSDALGQALASLAAAEPDADVRLQLAATARRLPAVRGLPIVARLLERDEDATDPRQPLMLWWAIEAHAITDRERVLFLLKEAGTWERPLVAGHLLERLMRRYAAEGGPRDLETCAELLRRAPSDAARARLLAGFELAFRDRSLAGLPESLAREIARAGGGSPAVQLRTGQPGALPKALSLAVDEKAEESTRAQVIQTLGELRIPEAVDALLTATESERESVRVAALASLQAFDRAEVAERVLGRLVRETGATRTAALGLLASRAGWSLQLVRAIERGELRREVVGPEAVALLARHQDPELTEGLGRLWPRAGAGTAAEMEGRMTRFAGIVQGGAGDPYNGKKLFTAACASCHKLFNAGGSVGPDLTPFRREDLAGLLLSVVNPSAEIREGYENILVETTDERSLSGFVIRQDDQVLVLRGLDGQDVVVRRTEIREQRAAGMSLMPEGLLEGMEEQQVRDLFAYLRSSQPLAN